MLAPFLPNSMGFCDFLSNQIATVDADGISKDVRLDIIDHWPSVGDYVIIHAGFAIHKIDEAAAMETLRFLKEAAAFVEKY